MIAVGIDVSKSKSTVAILNSDGTPLARPFNMAHTLPEMNSFVERLRALDAPVAILMEYTGHYHYPVLKKLQAKGFPVCLINPYRARMGRTEDKERASSVTASLSCTGWGSTLPRRERMMRR